MIKCLQKVKLLKLKELLGVDEVLKETNVAGTGKGGIDSSITADAVGIVDYKIQEQVN